MSLKSAVAKMLKQYEIPAVIAEIRENVEAEYEGEPDLKKRLKSLRLALENAEEEGERFERLLDDGGEERDSDDSDDDSDDADDEDRSDA
jgi:hypothetical protein